MLRRSFRRGCFFAPKPPPSSPELLEFARQRSHGVGVYTSRADALAVLQAVQAGRPAWWTDECTTLVTRLAALSEAQIGALPVLHHPVIVVEGLDGVGKTTVTTKLAERFGGKLIRTPNPDLDQVRGRFRVLEDVLARAFYAAGNYLAAQEIVAVSATQAVIVDRWHASTAAMALSGIVGELPAKDHPAYLWPSDMALFDLGYLLDVPEDIRLKRMAKRGDTNVEEAKLAADAAARARATDAYLRIGPRPLDRVLVPTYMIAINSILDKMKALAASEGGAPFVMPTEAAMKPYSVAEQLTCKPY